MQTLRLSILMNLFPISLSVGLCTFNYTFTRNIQLFEIIDVVLEKRKTKESLKESGCKNFKPHNKRFCNFFLKRSIIEKKTSIIFSQASSIEKHFSSILERSPKHMSYGIQLELTEEKSLIYLCLCSSFLVT